MAYFIQNIFGFAGNTAINLSQITSKLASRALGLDEIVSDDTENLVAATIKYSDSLWKEKQIGLDDVSLELTDREGNTRTAFTISKGGNTISVAGNDSLSLDYINLLGPNDNGSSRQRYVISQLLGELENSGYVFKFETVETKISDVNDGNKEILNITAINPVTGNAINVNQMLLKYGVCKYSDLGSGEGGGYSMNNKVKMKELSNEAYKLNRGMNWSEVDLVKLSQDERRLKPTENFKNSFIGNSKVESNMPFENAFHSNSEESKFMFKIGDVWLKIPPTHVTISQMRNSYTVPLIGLESKPLSTPVSRTIIKLNVVFTGEQVFDDLVRILTQFRYCPINMLRSKDLFNRVAGSDSFLYKNYSGAYYIPVTMDQYTLFNVDGHPGTVSAVFQFSLFNYNAYIQNPYGLEYYKYNPGLGAILAAIDKGLVTIDKNKNGDAIGFNKLSATSVTVLGETSNKTETTWRLEEASHPYNANIEARIKEVKSARKSGELYDMENSKIQFWKVDMDRYFNNTKGLQPEHINLDNEKNLDNFLKYCVNENELFTETAQSISVSYNNVFAYQPVLGQSHPVAQYVGPGETVVSVNLKGIDMEVDSNDRDMQHDQRMMCSLLKTWSEKYGTAEYGFFDDRYFVRSTLLNLADVNIVSIQNTVMTSVESKPGLFDINILMSKSMFEYNLRNNPISTLDEYYGLSRMTRIYGENKRLNDVAKRVNDKIKVAYSTLTDRLGSGVTLNGSSPALNVILQDIFNDIKNTKKVYWNGRVDLPEMFKKDIQNATWLTSSARYQKIDAKTVRFTIDATPPKANLKVQECKSTRIVFTDSKFNSLSGVAVKVSGASISGNSVILDVTVDNPSRLNYIRGVQAYVVYNFMQESNYTVDNEEVYKNLLVAINADSYNILPSDNFDEMQNKAKYLSFASLMNEITSAQNTQGATLPYGISNSQLQKVENGVTYNLWDNKEFMERYYTNFVTEIGRVPGQYETSGGTFDEKSRKNFIKNLMGKERKWYQIAWDEGSLKDSSSSNHYHLATGNGVVLEYNNSVADKLQNIIGDKTGEVGKKIRDQIDAVIKSHSSGNIIGTEWKQVGNTNKWQKLIILTAKGKKLKDKKADNILANEIEKNKKIIEDAQKEAKKSSYSKPWAAHRYYPLVEGYVGWSQLMSASVGDWFVCEMEEDTVRRFNKFKEVARTSMPWNRDAKLFDKNCPNSGYIMATEASGMLQYVDTKNPLSALAAIARPKMNRDMSAAREAGKGIIPDVQFLKKAGVMLFGEDAVKDPTSTNQIFNTMMDYIYYMDGSTPDNQVDYMNTRLKYASDYREKDAAYQKAQEDIKTYQVDYLKTKAVDKSRFCANTESKFHYSPEATSAMIGHVNTVTSNAIVVNGNATPMGQATGQTAMDEGTNHFGYQFSINDQTLKPSPLYININSEYAALRAGAYVRNGVPYDPKTGKPALDKIKDAQVIPDVNTKTVDRRSVTIEGDKLANVLATSYIESLPATKGVQNAFPTYKMYIIKSDTSDYKFSSLDDYWDYRLVQDIMVVRDKNTPTHMLKARVVVDPRYITIGPDYKFRTGVDNRLHHAEERQTQVPVDYRDTVAELRSTYVRDKAPLRPGMRICIKLGYHTDPRFLDTVFIGTITQLNGSLDSGLYELSAEGDGRELRVPAVHWSDKFNGDNYTDIINAIMRVNPNVVHFGKIYGSFLRRMSYGHKNLAQLGMLGVSAVGAFGAGVAGVAIPGGAAVWAGKKALAFKASSSILTGAVKGGGLIGSLVGLGASVVAGTVTFPIAFGEFQQMGQWTKPSFDEVIARRFLETDWAQDLTGRTHRTLITNIPYTNVPLRLPLMGELSGVLKGNVFNANKQAYQLSKHFYNTYKYGNNPLDDNIFAIDIWNNVMKKASLNINNKQSIWDVLQTVKRLYPNYALDVRPYGSRSTIFLGPIGFNYWRTDDPVQAILPQLNQMEGLEVDSQVINNGVRKAIDKFSLPADSLGDNERRLQEKIKVGNDDVRSALGLTRAPFIPFQKHHLITSDEDIIMNGLKPTPERGWNAVSVTYGSDPTKVNPKDIIEFMADLDLYPESIIKRPIHVDFTNDAEVATRYALGFLKEGVERLYGGTIILKGNSRIEPYDKIYVYDKVNKMYGWIQVETVIHKFDQEMGYTTHIVPNMVCEINNNAYLSTQNIVMSTLYEKGGLGMIAKDLAIGTGVSWAATAAGLASSTLFAVGAFAYFAVTAVKDFRESWESGKNYVSKFKNMQLSDKQLASEKIMVQDIMMSAMEQDSLIKGLKFGWATGYLYQRGAINFLKPWDKTTLSDQIQGAADAFKKQITANYYAAKSTLSENLGSESPLAEAWKTSKIRNELRDTLSTIENGEITAESLNENVNLEAAKAEWQAEYKKFRDLVERGDTDTAKSSLENLKKLEEKFYKPEVSKLIKEDLSTKIFDNVEKLKGRAAKPNIVSSIVKGTSGSVSKGFSGATKLFNSIFGLGGLSWLAMGASEFLPTLAYSFAVKAVTKNNVMSVSPIYWRDTYLMPSLDGYMANDMFMHIGDMLINAQDTITEAKSALRNYLPQVFPVQDSKFNAVEFDGVQSVSDSVMTDFSQAGEYIKCIVKNSGLKDIPSDSEFSTDKWNFLAQYIKQYGNIADNEDSIVFLLSLLYFESRFKLTATSKKNAHGIGQIVPSDSNYNDKLKINAINCLVPYTGNDVKASVLNGNFAPLLDCIGATPATLKYYIYFNIKSISDILNEKFKNVTRLWWNQNTALYKKIANSNQKHIVFALLLYAAYNGFSSGFGDRLLSSGFISGNGSLNINMNAKSFKNYTSEDILWKDEGFLAVYLAMANGYSKCVAQQQKETAPKTTQVSKKGDKVVDWSASKMKKDIADVAYGYVASKQTFTTSNATRYSPRKSRNLKDSIIDCSAFVGTVVDTAVKKWLSISEVKNAYLDVTGTGSGFSDSRTMATKGVPVSVVAAQPGDLVFYKDSSGTVKHVEIYYGNLRSIGTSDSKGQIVFHNINDHPTYGNNYQIRSYFNY